MYNERKTRIAKITGTRIDVERTFLTAWVYVDIAHQDGGGSQGFGGSVLLASEHYKGDKLAPTDWAGIFIKGVLDAVGVEAWENLEGCYCRIQSDSSRIYAIGNAMKDKWFDVDEEWKKVEASLT